jgi:hypothetical protein
VKAAENGVKKQKRFWRIGMQEKEVKKLLNRMDQLISMLHVQAQATTELTATLQFMLEENQNGQDKEDEIDEPRPL